MFEILATFYELLQVPMPIDKECERFVALDVCLLMMVLLPLLFVQDVMKGDLSRWE